VKTFTDQFQVRHELIKRIHAAFREHDIRFAEVGKSAAAPRG
jgi:hypothetical protein